MRKNEFLLRFGYEALDDKYKTTLVYKKFIPSNDQGFNDYISDNLLNHTNFPLHSEKLSKAILRNIFEIFENARTHGDCDYIHTCGQFFPNKKNKPLHFTIVDKGINIQKNVNDFLTDDFNALNLDSIFVNFGPVDFNDAYINEIVKLKKCILVTEDKGFKEIYSEKTLVTLS